MDLLSEGLRALQQNLFSIPAIAIEEITPDKQYPPDIALRIFIAHLSLLTHLTGFTVVLE